MSNTPQQDEFHGQGGSYVIEGGVRRRVMEPEQTPVDAGNTPEKYPTDTPAE